MAWNLKSVQAALRFTKNEPLMAEFHQYLLKLEAKFLKEKAAHDCRPAKRKGVKWA